jgi:hypothetical protein
VWLDLFESMHRVARQLLIRTRSVQDINAPAALVLPVAKEILYIEV